MNQKKLKKTLRLFARADLRRAQKQGSETIEETAFGTLVISYRKASETFHIAAKVAGKAIDMGEHRHRDAERILMASYIVYSELASNQ